MLKPVSIFISYSHKDLPFMEELQNFLTPNIQDKKISVWTDYRILAGQEWDKVIKENLKKSSMIIFLVSQNFIISDYINKIEVKIAEQNDKMIIIPVLIGAIQMQRFPLRNYQVLPTGAIPVDQWEPQNKAWVNVVDELDKVINALNENSKTEKRVVTTDRIFMSLIIFLLLGCIIMFVYGVYNESNFHTSTALFGIGISLAGYLFGKKLLAF